MALLSAFGLRFGLQSPGAEPLPTRLLRVQSATPTASRALYRPKAKLLNRMKEGPASRGPLGTACLLLLGADGSAMDAVVEVDGGLRYLPGAPQLTPMLQDAVRGPGQSPYQIGVV